MVIGSRFMDGSGTHSGMLRAAAIVFFRAILRPILGRPVRDPTSGFVGVNRTALAVFSRSFPLEYRRLKPLSYSSASDFASSRCLAGCALAALAGRRSHR